MIDSEIKIIGRIRIVSGDPRINVFPSPHWLLKSMWRGAQLTQLWGCTLH